MGFLPMTDREQIRRDAEVVTGMGGRARTLADATRALLAELEQAERERDGALRKQLDLARDCMNLRADLAAVPALVEALEIICDIGETRDVEVARRALAAYEQAQHDA